MYLDSLNYFRIKVNSIHPDDLFVASSNGKICKSENLNYDFMIKPAKRGILDLYIFADIDSQKRIIKMIKYKVK